MLTPATTKEISPCLIYFSLGVTKREYNVQYSLGHVNSFILSIDVEEFDFSERAITTDNVWQGGRGDSLVFSRLEVDNARECRLATLFQYP